MALYQRFDTSWTRNRHMKVLIVNVNSHTGSTGKIAYGLYRYLQKNGDEVKLCCRGTQEAPLQDKDIIELDSIIEVYYSSIMSRLTGYDGIFNPIATTKLIHIIDEFLPDVVHLMNLPGFYVSIFRLLEYLKQKRIRTIYSMMDDYPFAGKCTFVRDCEKYTSQCGNCPYLSDYPPSLLFDFSKQIFKRKKEIYDGFEELTITGVQWSCQMARKSALTKNNHIVHVDHPVNYDDVFYPRDAAALKTELGIPLTTKVVLTAVSARAERKGGRYFLELARRMSDRKDVIFVFVGYDRDDWDVPTNMVTVGYVKSQDLLAKYYSMADLYVCTSLADTFPTTCLNALGCGTPLLGFKAGGVPYSAEEPYGKFVTVKDVDSLEKECRNLKAKDAESSALIRQYALERYSESVVFKKFRGIYDNQYTEFE